MECPYVLIPLIHKIFNDIGPEILRGGIKRPPLTERGEALYKRQQRGIVRQHKRVEPDALLTASFGFFIRLMQNHWMQLTGMAVELVGMACRRGPSVCDHENLFIRPMLSIEQHPRPLQASLGVGVVAAGDDKWEVCDAKLMCTISKAHNIQNVMRKMNSNQLGQRQGDAFGCCKAVLMVCCHALAHIQDERGGMGRAGFRLKDDEIACLELQRNARLSTRRFVQCLRQVGTKCIAKVIRFGLMSQHVRLARDVVPWLPPGRLTEERLEKLGAQMPNAWLRQPQTCGGSANEPSPFQKGL